MERKYKTFINSHGEFGVIEITPFDEVMIGTSQMPTLFTSEANLEDIKSYYEQWRSDETGEKIIWDQDIPKDWKLVEVELIIK